MTENDFSWKLPVDVTLTSGLRRRFTNAYDALDFLAEEWPTRRGIAYNRAIRLCRIALRSDRAAELARIAFVAAALEAGMHQADALKGPRGPAPRRRSVA